MKVSHISMNSGKNSKWLQNICDKFLSAMLTTSSEFHILSFHVAIKTRMADIHNLTKMERQCINTVPFWYCICTLNLSICREHHYSQDYVGCLTSKSWSSLGLPLMSFPLTSLILSPTWRRPDLNWKNIYIELITALVGISMDAHSKSFQILVHFQYGNL